LWFYHYGSYHKQALQLDKKVLCGSRRMHLTMDALSNLDIWVHDIQSIALWMYMNPPHVQHLYL
jgi:hypothetical protein